MSWRSIALFLALFFALATALLASSDESYKIESALLIGDLKRAEEIVKLWREENPEEEEPLRYEIEVACAEGREEDAFRLFSEYEESYPEGDLDGLLEKISFSIMKKGFNSSNLAIKELSLLALAITQDIEGTLALTAAMQEKNKAIRALAVSLSGHYGDRSLRAELASLLEREKSVEVLEVLYEAIAKLKIRDLTPNLVKRLGDERVSSREKKKLLTAIAIITENLQDSELEWLAKNRSTSLRILSAHAIWELNYPDKIDLLVAMLDDYHPEVKKAALACLAGFQKGPKEKFKELAALDHPEIATLAAKALFLIDEEAGRAAFEPLLNNPSIEIRRLAGFALASSGRRALPLLEERMECEKDPYILASIAIAFLENRYRVDKGGDLLFAFLSENSEPLMEGDGSFFTLARSTLKGHPLIASYRTSVDQAVRFKLLNLLAIVEHPKASEAIKNFLMERRWQVVGLAAEILLSEGDETIVDILKGFLNEKDRKLKEEAALLLSALDEEEAIPALIELYHSRSSREKLMLLEAIGSQGGRSEIPFFVEELKNPSQTLRIGAAAMLVRLLRN